MDRCSWQGVSQVAISICNLFFPEAILSVGFSLQEIAINHVSATWKHRAYSRVFLGSRLPGTRPEFLNFPENRQGKEQVVFSDNCAPSLIDFCGNPGIRALYQAIGIPTQDKAEPSGSKIQMPSLPTPQIPGMNFDRSY